MKLYNRFSISNSTTCLTFLLQQLIFDYYSLVCIPISCPGDLSNLLDSNTAYILIVLVDRKVHKKIIQRELFINKITNIKWRRSIPVKLEYDIEYSNMGIEDRESSLISDYRKTWLLLEEKDFNEIS